MENFVQQKMERISQSITLKAIVIGTISLLMLIPVSMVEGLIREREDRKGEAVDKINQSWSKAQLINGPYLVIPYVTYSRIGEKMQKPVLHNMFVTPENLNVRTEIVPEVRHIGIYKSVLYRSQSLTSGDFKLNHVQFPSGSVVNWKDASIRIGLSDLRGMATNIEININKHKFGAEAAGENDQMGEGIVVALGDSCIKQGDMQLKFKYNLNLKGSVSLSFVPSGRTTHIEMAGKWSAPGFIGSFSPESKVNKDGFVATWNVLHFNRNIPAFWTDQPTSIINKCVVGVNLVDTVDQYQQSIRSAKYAFMFISLTFVVFFFVEILSKRRIHPIQYILIGVAMALFYSLLISLSEQISFSWAYMLASGATIGLITVYAYSIFRTVRSTAVLFVFLAGLYLFLFIILQLEDIALLVGSVGLFGILTSIMFASQKISWYKNHQSNAEVEPGD